MKKNGFTLAEILVTLGIIGIISAITVPTLMSNFQRKTYEAGAKKAYNTVANAVATYMADEKVDSLSQASFAGSLNAGGGSSSLKHGELEAFVRRYFKVTRVCDSYGECFSESFSSLDKSASTDWSKLTYTAAGLFKNPDGSKKGATGPRCVVGAQLADGMSMCISAATRYINTKPISSSSSSKLPIVGSLGDDLLNESEVMIVDVDINGPAGPNVTGRDIFTMSVSTNGVVGASTESVTGVTDSDKQKALPMDITYLLNKGWDMDY